MINSNQIHPSQQQLIKGLPAWSHCWLRGTRNQIRGSNCTDREYAAVTVTAAEGKYKYKCSALWCSSQKHLAQRLGCKIQSLILCLGADCSDLKHQLKERGMGTQKAGDGEWIKFKLNAYNDESCENTESEQKNVDVCCCIAFVIFLYTLLDYCPEITVLVDWA